MGSFLLFSVICSRISVKGMTGVIFFNCFSVKLGITKAKQVMNVIFH